MCNAFESYMDDLYTGDFDFIEKGLKPLEDHSKAVLNFVSRITDIIRGYKETGQMADLSTLENWQTCEAPVDRSRNSTKENEPPKVTSSGRPRRNAAKGASQTEQSNQFQNVVVKIEKDSIMSSKKSVSEEAEVKVKTEKVEEMPAPSRPAPRRRKKKEEEIKVKQEVRESDVIIQDVTITTVNLVDSDEGEKTLKNEEVRSTRTKTRKKTKRSRAVSPEDVKSREKRPKSNEEESENKDVTDHTEYEDAISTVEEPSKTDATFVMQATMNATMIIENPKLVKNNLNDIMTDDESEDDKKSPKKPFRGIPKTKKQIFSPFEQSPVKKKVEAFEKLQEASSVPVRITRTKTRARARVEEEADEIPQSETKGIVKEKAKIFTPMTEKFFPKVTSTSTKPNTRGGPSSNESLLSSKSASALKASQAEFRERERKRREKEQETLKKREALMQAQIEEKKRKREEKQYKAQQQREALEKEKLKTLEIQKLKDERHKQLIAEQEERKQKQKEEMEKKRQMAKMRAIEEKKKEEEKRIEEQRKADELTVKLAKLDGDMVKMLQKQKQRQAPIYMRVRCPLLPTEDCYDSDDERCTDKKYVGPSWSKVNNMRFKMRCASSAGDAIKNMFYSIQAQTPDLQDIFEVIEPQKLKRTSSAIWHKQPRFTMLPVLENHNETEEFDDE